MNQITDHEKKQYVLESWTKGRHALLEIKRDHADRQEQYSKEVRDFFRFQLSIAPVILGLIGVLGMEVIRDTPSLGWSIVLLIIFFIWGSVYLFRITNYLPISLYDSFKRIKES